MKLSMTYASKEEIPSGMEALYAEKDGAFVFCAIDGLKTSEDIDKVMGAKAHEVAARKAAEKKAADLERQIGELTDKLEVMTKNKPDESELQAKELAFKKMERDLKARGDEFEALKKEHESLTAKVTIDSIRKSIVEQAKGIVSDAFLDDDFFVNGHLSNFKLVDGKPVVAEGDNAGADVKNYFKAFVENRPNYRPESKGTIGADGVKINPAASPGKEMSFLDITSGLFQQK